MSLIEKSEIFRAKQSCENADSVTIATIFPTFKKKYGILQKKISHYRGDETVILDRNREMRLMTITKTNRPTTEASRHVK